MAKANLTDLSKKYRDLAKKPGYLFTEEDAKRYREGVATRLEHINALFTKSGWTEAYRDVFYVLNYIEERRGGNFDTDDCVGLIGNEERMATWRASGQIARENLLPESSYRAVERYIKYGITTNGVASRKKQIASVKKQMVSLALAKIQLEAAVQAAIEKAKLATQSGEGKSTGPPPTEAEKRREVIKKIVKVDNPGKSYSGRKLAEAVESAGCEMPEEDGKRRALIAGDFTWLQKNERDGSCYKTRLYRYELSRRKTK